MKWIEMESNPLMFETTNQIWYWSHLITCRFPTEDLKVVWHPLIITARGRWLDCTEALAGASEESESTQSFSPGYGSSLNKGWFTHIYINIHSQILLLSLLLLFLLLLICFWRIFIRDNHLVFWANRVTSYHCGVTFGRFELQISGNQWVVR